MNKTSQISIFDPVPLSGCSKCICRDCMHWWQGKCPYGSCYDDKRAKENSYINAHGGVERKLWSDWNKPGEQDHWCRGAFFYGTNVCEHYIHYEGQTIKKCLCANISVFQDNSIRCPLVEAIGCEECYRRFTEKLDEAV